MTTERIPLLTETLSVETRITDQQINCLALNKGINYADALNELIEIHVTPKRQEALQGMWGETIHGYKPQAYEVINDTPRYCKAGYWDCTARYKVILLFQ